MTVQALTTFDPQQFFTVRQGTDAPLRRSDTQVTGVAVSNDFSGRLSVTTDEGDTITLTADLEADYRAISYRSSGQAEGATVDVNAKYVEYSLKREFGVTVEGNLNEQELHDLEKLFRNVSNIFRTFLHGEDDEALAKTAKLADRFERLSSLSSLDLSLDIERSFTVLAAQVVSEVTGQPLPNTSSPLLPSAASPTPTPGGAPSTAAAIPQPSTGTTAPTPSPASVPAADASDPGRLTVPASTGQAQGSLVQQVFQALKDAKLESEKVHKYLPDFLKKLREELADELRGERGPKGHGQEPSVAHSTDDVHPPVTASSLFVAYQSVTHTAFSLSIHS